jgi:hypothetical protein
MSTSINGYVTIQHLYIWGYGKTFEPFKLQSNMTIENPSGNPLLLFGPSQPLSGPRVPYYFACENITGKFITVHN